MSEQLLASGTPIDEAVAIADATDGIELAMYRPDDVPMGPILVADGEETVEETEDIFDITFSEYGEEDIDLDATEDEIRETHTVVDALGLADV